MGVKGLFTFITTYYDDCLEWFKLQNCQVVIDGNNLAFKLYFASTEINRAYGGDYDKYAAEVEVFFKKLKKCDIKPIVIMDGGQPMNRKKFGTSIRRNRDAILTSLLVHPGNQHDTEVFPLLGVTVFINVVQEMGIDIIQSDFEADDDIAVIAKELNAFVISNDSDFFLFDVPFVLLNSLNYKCIQETYHHAGKYIPCYKFNIEKFCEMTGVHKDLIPIFALVLGNDYHDSGKLRNFYRKFETRSIAGIKNRKHRIIKCMTRWLSHQEPNLHKVMKKVIRYLPPTLSREHKETAKNLVDEYFPEDSNLLSWILPHEKECPLALNSKGTVPVMRTSLIPYSSTKNLPKKVSLLLSCKCKSRARTDLVVENRLPMWFVHVYRHLLTSRFVADIINKNYFFTHPLIEVEKHQSSYLVLEGVIKAIRAIIWSTIINYEESIKSQNLHSLIDEGSKYLLSAISEHPDEVKVSADVDKSTIEMPLKVNGEPVEIGHSNILANELPVKFIDQSCQSNNHLSSESEDDGNSGDSLDQENKDSLEPDYNEENSSESISDDLSNPNDKIMDLPMTYINEREVLPSKITQKIHNVSHSKKNDIIPCSQPNEISVTNCREKVQPCVYIEVPPSPKQLNEDKQAPRLNAQLLKDLSGESESEDLSDCASDQDDGIDNEFQLTDFIERREIPKISWYIRKGHSPWGKILHSEKLSRYKHLPTLLEMNTLSDDERKKLFFTICNLKECSWEETLPNNLKYILTVIVFWYTKYKEHIQLPHILSSLVCIIMFSIIDGKFGRMRNEGFFTELKETAKAVKHKVQPLASNFSSQSIQKIILDITKEECLLGSLNLHQYHRNTTHSKYHYDRDAVHGFSQYQASVYFLNILNSILYFPFPSVNISTFWSGTFSYNFFKCFSTNIKPYLVLKCILRDNVRILHLFLRLYEELRRNLDLPPIDEEDIPVPKEEKGKAMQQICRQLGHKKPIELNISTVCKKRRESNTHKPRRKKEVNPKPVQEYDQLTDPTEDDLIALAGNKFSMLLLSDPVLD